MIEVYERLGTHCHAAIDGHVILSHEQRDKGRLKVVTSDGDDVGIFLERGSPLLVGEYLRTRCGKHLIIEGAPEAVVIASTDNWVKFSRACYHLGNRHVKVELGELSLRILPDHVLEEMLELIGLSLKHDVQVFNPESGAYSHGHHHH